MNLVDSFFKDQISSKHKGPEIMDFAMLHLNCVLWLMSKIMGLLTSGCVSGTVVDKQLTQIGLCHSDFIAVADTKGAKSRAAYLTVIWHTSQARCSGPFRIWGDTSKAITVITLGIRGPWHSGQMLAKEGLKAYLVCSLYHCRRLLSPLYCQLSRNRHIKKDS